MMHLSQQWSTLYPSDYRNRLCAGYAALHSSDEVASVRVVEAEEASSDRVPMRSPVL